MSNLKLFIENFFIYGVGGIISKIIPLIMVPIITRLMPTTDYYGISDLSNTVVQFGSAVAIMGMYDAMYRMFFEMDEEEYKKNVCSTALTFTIFMSIIVFIVMILNRDVIARYFFGNVEYIYVVYLSAIATLVGAATSIISAPTRMQNRRKTFLVANTIGPILSYSFSVPLLLAGNYVIALPLAAIISGITMVMAFGVMNRKWFDLRRFDIKILKQLLFIAIPLFPNFLIYWIFNSCDKVMITNIIGIGMAGIYSVGSKLGHTSYLIYTAFAGGWQFFAFSTMKEDNQVKNTSMIFEYLGIISFVTSAFICAWSRFIFKWLFTEQYISGYIVAPYLFLAPLLQMLFQVACNQFIVIKKTWPNMFILSAGAIINILLDYTLIPVLGIEGASIATLCGYVVSDIICVIVLCRMKLMFIEVRFIKAAFSMLVYIIIWRFWFSTDPIIGSLFAFILLLVMIGLYKEEWEIIHEKIRNRLKK